MQEQAPRSVAPAPAAHPPPPPDSPLRRSGRARRAVARVLRARWAHGRLSGMRRGAALSPRLAAPRLRLRPLRRAHLPGRRHALPPLGAALLGLAFRHGDRRRVGRQGDSRAPGACARRGVSHGLAHEGAPHGRVALRRRRPAAARGLRSRLAYAVGSPTKRSSTLCAPRSAYALPPVACWPSAA